MKAFWWQGGLHMEPTTDAETIALQRLHEVFSGFGLVDPGDEIVPSPVVEGHNEQPIVGIHILPEVIA